jgi:proline iminopeptidase
VRRAAEPIPARDATPDVALFPPIEPCRSGRLPLDGRHTLYWECCGNPSGPSVVFLHGGPGGGSLPHPRRYYDPAFWNIVLYEQRGAGRSTPAASIDDNTTPHLVADLERLRESLAIERWLVFGGSWGSTLALAYAQAYPERALGLVLRGIFLATRAEFDWFLYGARAIFPEAWRAFAHFLPAVERGDLLAGYHRRLTDPDPAVHLPAARSWSRYETACSTLLPQPDAGAKSGDDVAALAIARIEAHYFIHQGFLQEGELLAGIPRIRHLPCTIVQGRYDIVCPPVTAHTLATAWPEAEYIVVPDAGHSMHELGITRELMSAVQRMKEGCCKCEVDSPGS